MKLKNKITIGLLLALTSCSSISVSFTYIEQSSSQNISSSDSKNSENTINNTTYSSVDQNNTDDLSIHFLELGNQFTGDSIYIKAGETDILIDAGSRTTSSQTLTNYIDKYCKDNTLEYVISTHAHQDHIAGFIGSNQNPGVLRKYKVNTLIDFPLTNQNDGENTIYGKYKALVNQQVNDNNCSHYTALECFNNENGAQRIYNIANGIKLEILYQKFYEEKSSDENNYSVCVLLSQNENHFLFTGDLEKEGEVSLVENNNLPHVKIFKGGHHGSKTSSGEQLLSKITPENVCICTCAGTAEYTDNKDNQFPTQDAINRIAQYTDKIYVTSQVDKYVDNKNYSKSFANGGGSIKSMNGNIIATSTYNTFQIHGSNNDIILKDTEWFKANRTWPIE